MLSRLPRLCVAFCHRHAWRVLAVALLSSLGAASYVATTLDMDTDTGRLFPDDLRWRQLSMQFDAAFPQNDDLLVVVIDAQTSEQADAAAAALAARLADEPLARAVRRPDADDFFRRNGLLYLEEPELAELSARIVDMQPLLGALARDTSLHGLFTTLAQAGDAPASGEFDWQRLAAPMQAVAPAIGISAILPRATACPPSVAIDATASSAIRSEAFGMRSMPGAFSGG